MDQLATIIAGQGRRLVSYHVKRSRDTTGVSYNNAYVDTKAPNDNQSPLNGAQFTVLFFTALIGITVIGLLQYTFKLLLTLSVVEEPPAVYLPLDSDNDTEALNAAPTPRLVTQDSDRVFITSSIRGTLRHLRREAGIWSPWRGLGANIAFAFANGIVRGVFAGILQFVLPLHFARVVGGIASMVALSRFAMVCTHIMISAPQPTYWWTRLHSTTWTQAKKTIPAVLIWAAAIQLVAELSILGARQSMSGNGGAVGLSLTIYIIDILLYILVAIPATILLVRVQASVLADDVVTVVPFDKTFGQDTSDTDGVLTVKKAVKSIDCACFKRVCVFLAKSLPVLMAVMGVFVGAFVVMFVSWAK